MNESSIAGPVPSGFTQAVDSRRRQDVAIRVRGLQHYFGDGELRKQVLFNNNLDIMRGEIVIMTGPSGSGKTTLLTLIGTLRSVQEGSLKVLDQELRGATPLQLRNMRREIGFIFQAHNLFDSLTAAQNVKMSMELFSLDRAQNQQQAESMLQAVGLGHRIHYKPGSLSGGQKQRVAIARGLVHKPKIILADEPTAALDERSGRDVVNLFQELVKTENCTILIVTHDNRILDAADRIVSLVDGRIKSNVLVRESAVICQFLHKCSVFASLTPQTLAEAADRMNQEIFNAGDEIIRQGDPGEKFYVVRNGELDVVLGESGSTRVKAHLVPGDYFGETALLTGAPRNATVVATTEVELYSLGKAEFQEVLRLSGSFEEQLRKAIFGR